MRKIWFFMVLASLITLLFFDPEDSINAMMNAGAHAVSLTIRLLGIYAVWLGIIALVDACGVSNKLASLLDPIIDYLFGKTDKDTKKYIALNMSANILGMGNACTPTGLKAMQGLDKQNNSLTASTAMIMLVVINATSIQLIPTTIIGLRQQYGSLTSSDIILPTIISTLVSTLLGVILVKFCDKFMKKWKSRKNGNKSNFLSNQKHKTAQNDMHSTLHSTSKNYKMNKSSITTRSTEKTQKPGIEFKDKKN